jgi:signal transduction histidine kinase
LAATVSHELKTPLAAIRLLVDTLLDQERPDPQQAREYLQLVARENERLTRLIDNFLTFSRMERGRQQFTLATVEPGEVARRAIESMQERLHDPNCRFESRIEPELPAIVGDVDALVTVLVNLLDNALKYTRNEKQITLSVYVQDGCVCFAVADDGIGMSLRNQRRVFDRFFQVDQKLSRPAGGCGLGLSIVRTIMAAHNGTIDVKSELAKGSTFTVRIPVAACVSSPDSPTDAIAVNEPTSASIPAEPVPECSVPARS